MVEEDLVVGTVPLLPLVPLVALVPLEPFESLGLFGIFSILDIVFLRRSSLKKGIIPCRCLVYCPKKVYVSNCLEITASGFMERSV